MSNAQTIINSLKIAGVFLEVQTDGSVDVSSKSIRKLTIKEKAAISKYLTEIVEILNTTATPTPVGEKSKLIPPKLTASYPQLKNADNLAGVTTFNGQTGDVVGVSSVNGLTGAVTLVDLVGVSTFNGLTGAVEGVGTFNGSTGAITGVSTFNGLSGAVEGVGTFNGSTGAVEGVGTFNGSTGAITGVNSWNGLSGAVEGVGTFNGSTGAITGVNSWNGLTGAVDVTNSETIIGGVTLGGGGATFGGNVTAPSFFGGVIGSLHMKIKADEAIAECDPVYITGNVGASDTLTVAKADASNPAKMPAAGLADSALSTNDQGHMLISGTHDKLDTSGYTTNQTIYVADGGGLTSGRPTGAGSLIQNIARAGRIHASTGTIIVTGAGRSNDVPNALMIHNYIETPGGYTTDTLVGSWNGLTGDVDVTSSTIHVGGISADGGATFSSDVTAPTFVGALTGNVNGNASGTSATVTTAAQPNITSVGILTSLQTSGGISAGAGSTFGGDVHFGGNLILPEDGEVQISGDTEKIVFNGGSSRIDLISGQVMIGSGGGNGYLGSYGDNNTSMRYQADQWTLKVGGTDYIDVTTAGTNFADTDVVRPNLKDYSETVNEIGTITGDRTISLEDGNVQTVTVSSGAIEFDFDNWPATGIAGTVTLIITNGGSQTVTWESAVKWPGDNAPALTSSGIDIISFMTTDAGTNIYGFVGGINFS